MFIDMPIIEIRSKSYYSIDMDYIVVCQRVKPHIDKLKQIGVKRIAVFGSVARGATKEASDLDILVRFEDNEKTFDNFMELKFFLQEIFPEVQIDLVLEDSLKETIRRQILSEARDVIANKLDSLYVTVQTLKTDYKPKV